MSATKVATIKKAFNTIIETLGLNLPETADRIAKMYVEEVFSGLNQKNFPKVSFTQSDQKGMVLVKRIAFTSFCEHHFVPMFGHISVAYIPNGKLIGLSKIPRIVHFFARKPQMQERLTEEIANCLSKILGTPHVAIHASAKHLCMCARGVHETESNTVTTCFRGNFETTQLRQEFLSLL